MTATNAPDQVFPTDATGLPACRPTDIVQLADGDTFDLRIAPVAKHLDSPAPVRMLAYNGSIPGPTVRVRQGSAITVRVRNDGDHETTVHWHGLRLDNEYDGVPQQTQAPIPVGGEFTYKLRFPDDGVYWYHPHVREDYGLEMGLYGNLLVDPTEPDTWTPVNREAIVTLDDVLIEEGRIAPFRVDGPTHTAMGRFGNVMLAAGSTDLRLEAHAGEVVRFFLTNTANTRVFDVGIPGVRMKRIGGDSGRYEREEWVPSVMLAPSERVVVDVRFDDPGQFQLEHRTPDRTWVMATVEVRDGPVEPSLTESFETLHVNPELSVERQDIDALLERPPDKTLVFDSLMPILYGDEEQTATAWTCPMHPEIVRSEPGTCPICGMKLIPLDDAVAAAVVPSGEHDHEHHLDHEHHHDHGSGDGIEWEDLMPDVNARTDASNMVWKLVDAETGQENDAIDWTFRVGDRVKIRLVNTMESEHPMHHPFHIHGAGRFLVLSRDGVVESNLVWKDTVFVRAGETVDIAFDATEPGTWMAHCHIAEHNQVGMMLNFRVAD